MFAFLNDNPGFAINVWNCRAQVCAWVRDEHGGWYLEPAANWEELEDEAADAVYEQGGGINLSGQYYCPPELASKGQW